MAFAHGTVGMSPRQPPSFHFAQAKESALAKKRTNPGNATKGRNNVITLLTEDHDKVRKLLSELEETTTRGMKKRTQLVVQIAREVRLHARAEEEIFYPAFREAGEESEDEKLFFEAAEEHGLVDVVLPKLEQADPTSELFSAQAKVLKDLIEHHAEEEEKEIFPRARKLMDNEQLKELRTQIEELKAEWDAGDLTPVARKGSKERSAREKRGLVRVAGHGIK